MMTGVDPLPKVTLLEAESDSLVQLWLKICSFYNEVYERLKKKERKRNVRFVTKQHYFEGAWMI